MIKSINNLIALVFLAVLISLSGCRNSNKYNSISVDKLELLIPVTFQLIQLDSIPTYLNGLFNFKVNQESFYKSNNDILSIQSITRACKHSKDDIILFAEELNDVYSQVYASGNWRIDTIINHDNHKILLGSGSIDFTFGFYYQNYAILCLSENNYIIQSITEEPDNGLIKIIVEKLKLEKGTNPNIL